LNKDNEILNQEIANLKENISDYKEICINSEDAIVKLSNQVEKLTQELSDSDSLYKKTISKRDTENNANSNAMKNLEKEYKLLKSEKIYGMWADQTMIKIINAMKNGDTDFIENHITKRIKYTDGNIGRVNSNDPFILPEKNFYIWNDFVSYFEYEDESQYDNKVGLFYEVTDSDTYERMYFIVVSLVKMDGQYYLDDIYTTTEP